MSTTGGMIAVQNFGGEALDHATKVLAGIPDGVNKAIRSALPRTVSSLRGESVRAIQTKYDISAENIRSKQNISIKYSYGTLSEAYIMFSGRKIPLYRYNGTSPKNPTVNTSRMKSGHVGIFERTGGVTAGGRDQIKELQGLSVPQMLGNESVQNHLADKASQKFEERMEHEILRILNGWGQSK